MSTRILHVALLVVVWLALWGDVSFANLIGGAAVALIVVGVFGTWRPGDLTIRPLRALKFVLYFLYKLVEASIIVARTIVAPTDRIRTGIVAVPIKGCSDATTTLIANTISLTPGTLALMVRPDPPTLFVHVLFLRDVEHVRREIGTLEVLAIEAFGGPTALAGVKDAVVRQVGR